MHKYRSKNLTLFVREIEAKRPIKTKLALASIVSNLTFPNLNRRLDVTNSYFPDIHYMKEWYSKHLNIDTQLIDIPPVIKTGSFDGETYIDVEFDLRKPSGWHKTIMIIMFEVSGSLYPIGMTGCRRIEKGMRYTIPAIHRYSFDYMDEGERFNFKRLQ